MAFLVSCFSFDSLCLTNLKSCCKIIYMKITLNEKNLSELDKIFSTRDENIEVSSLYNSILNENYNCITEDIVKEFMLNNGLSRNEAVIDVFYNFLNLSSDDPLVEKMNEDTSFGSINELNVDEFINHSFNKLQIKNIALGPYRLEYNYFEPFELFNNDETTADKNNYYSEHTKVSYFPSKVKYLSLIMKNKVWMSITPHEINTMREDIKNAYGNVITFGLGLGYYAYEVSKKENVNSVTIIEKDSKVIELFKRNILPSFINQEKIKIIKADAFNYFENDMKDSNYDYAFIDIYHTPDDALPLYLKFKHLEKKHSFKNIHYWIEKSILCLFRRYVLALLEEYFQGYTMEDYQNENTIEDKIMKKLFNHFKDKCITSIEEINYLLTDENLINLSKEIQF